MSTAIVTSDTSEDHITGDGHPEQPKRVSAVVNKLKKGKIYYGLSQKSLTKKY